MEPVFLKQPDALGGLTQEVDRYERRLGETLLADQALVCRPIAFPQ